MAYIVDIQTAFPKNYYNQDVIIEALSSEWKERSQEVKLIKKIHSNVLVKGRHLALPIESYLTNLDFDSTNKAFIETATEISVSAINKILDNNSISPESISALWSNTVTGFSIPSLESRVMNRITFSSNTKRVPIIGLGCMAGVAGVNRVSEYLKGHPDQAVIFFTVELCSLTFQLDDLSIENLVATGLFGDGAAAVLMVGEEHPLKNKAKLKWHDSESTFFPNTEDVMGWQIGKSGLKVLLRKDVPAITEKEIPLMLNKFLDRKKLVREDIKTIFAHPGGPKVLSAMEKAVGLAPKSLIHSWESLAHNGNMSSVSILDIMNRNINHPNKEKGLAISIAMGPAFSAEMGLLEWI